jgi:hypothetical protein
MEKQRAAESVNKHAEMRRPRIGRGLSLLHCYSLSVADTASVELQNRRETSRSPVRSIRTALRQNSQDTGWTTAS